MDPILSENLIKLGMAVLVGGVIGAEREYQDKAAGFRTIILITVGSTLFTIFSLTLDPGFTQTRIAANIVTGIGFLGAGAIIREHGKVGGLTTAATIWLSAALGMGIGAGQLVFVSISTLVILIVLLVFPQIEKRIDRIRESRTYKITLASGTGKGFEKINRTLEANSLTIFERRQTKTERSITSIWRVSGSPGNHEKFVEALLKDKDVKELDY
ncbi:MAG: MgtC/SapB family protein [Anaerolineales bacterium]|nr:MAG: MgtC/SapB family protein [Anaerolineales bacterium]